MIDLHISNDWSIAWQCRYQWDVTTVAPSVESVDNVWLGILLDPHQATVVHDLGPYGGSPEVISIIIVIYLSFSLSWAVIMIVSHFVILTQSFVRNWLGLNVLLQYIVYNFHFCNTLIFILLSVIWLYYESVIVRKRQFVLQHFTKSQLLSPLSL